MDKAYENVEDDLDDNFWHTALRTHLGREVLDNAESECVKAVCRGEMALADVLNDEVERQKRIDAEIEKDPDSEVPEMQAYLRIAADIDGVEPPLEWTAEVKDSISDDLEKRRCQNRVNSPRPRKRHISKPRPETTKAG